MLFGYTYVKSGHVRPRATRLKTPRTALDELAGSLERAQTNVNDLEIDFSMMCFLTIGRTLVLINFLAIHLLPGDSVFPLL